MKRDVTQLAYVLGSFRKTPGHQRGAPSNFVKDAFSKHESVVFFSK